MAQEGRKLGLWAALVLVAGNMIGSGLYLLPATLGAVGSITVLSWLIAGGGALVLALVFAYLGLLRPKADGAVAYASEGLGPALGHFGWFTYWITCCFGTSGVAVAATGYLSFFFPALKATGPGVASSIAIIWLMVGANFIGPKLVARIGAATLLVGLIPIALAIGVGFASFRPEIFAASWNVSGRSDLDATLTSVTPIFWAFLGLECANIVAAIIDNPRRNLPLAAVGGVALALGVYLLASVAILGLLPAHTLAASTAPFAEAIRGVAGGLTAALVAACALAKTFGALGGWILVGAESNRSGAAVGFLPRWTSDVAPDSRMARDLILVGLIMSVSIYASASPTLGKQFGVLINVTVVISMVLYLLCSLALVKMAAELETARSRWVARTAGVLGALFSAGVIAVADPTLRLPTLGVAVISFAFYGVSRWRRLQPA
ncbi:amino acid permease [Phenylobacterium aquaticum]|uniref:amino acid permease n=1 Tax=Phenylobacterium aquaticum TaxID=1763816 RepID=UPI0026F1D479|nr:amino acid permease [Phenylobacterium aquaticum]